MLLQTGVWCSHCQRKDAQKVDVNGVSGLVLTRDRGVGSWMSLWDFQGSQSCKFVLQSCIFLVVGFWGLDSRFEFLCVMIF